MGGKQTKYLSFFFSFKNVQKRRISIDHAILPINLKNKNISNRPWDNKAIFLSMGRVTINRTDYVLNWNVADERESSISLVGERIIKKKWFGIFILRSYVVSPPKSKWGCVQLWRTSAQQQAEVTGMFTRCKRCTGRSDSRWLYKDNTDGRATNKTEIL